MTYALTRTQEWFDPAFDRDELAIGPDDALFAQAGAGDHVLCLLGAGPKVIMVAGAPEEMALVELKLAALKSLAHGEWLEFLGVKPSNHRPELYLRVRWLLSTETASFWEQNADLLRRGLVGQGELERGLAGFRRFAAIAVGGARLESFLQLTDLQAQRDAVQRDFRGFLWRKFAERVLAAAWPGMAMRRLEEAMTASPAKSNAALNWLFAARAIPMTEAVFDALKVLANRVILTPQPPERAFEAMPDGSFDVFAMGGGAMSAELTAQVIRTGRPGARIVVRGAVLPGEFVERRGRTVDRGLWPTPATAAMLVGEGVANPT